MSNLYTQGESGSFWVNDEDLASDAAMYSDDTRAGMVPSQKPGYMEKLVLGDNFVDRDGRLLCQDPIRSIELNPETYAALVQELFDENGCGAAPKITAMVYLNACLGPDQLGFITYASGKKRPIVADRRCPNTKSRLGLHCHRDQGHAGECEFVRPPDSPKPPPAT